MTTLDSGPLSRAKVEAHIADTQARIDTLTAVADRLEELADDERREQHQIEGQLAAFRALVAERGVVEP